MARDITERGTVRRVLEFGIYVLEDDWCEKIHLVMLRQGLLDGLSKIDSNSIAYGIHLSIFLSLTVICFPRLQFKMNIVLNVPV